MKKCLFFIFYFFIFFNSKGQFREIKYWILSSVQGGSKRDLFFSAMQKEDCYFFKTKTNKFTIVYNNDAEDIIKDSIVYGPYKFVKKNNVIQFGVFEDSIWSFKDLYHLNSNTSFLIPDLLSSSTDSYNIRCSLADTNYMFNIDGKKYKFYKFVESKRSDVQSSYRIVYLNKKNFLPYRIEYYADKELKLLSTLVESDNYY